MDQAYIFSSPGRMPLSWDHIVWITALGLQPLIIAAIWWRRILPAVWALPLYLGFGFIRSLILMIYAPHLALTEHAVLYWRLTAIGYVFQAALAAQIAMQCVKQPLSTVVFLFAEAVAVIEVIMVMTAEKLPPEPLVLLNTLTALVCLGIVFLALVVNSMRWPCQQLAWGMVVIMLGQTMTGLYRISFGTWNHWEITRRITPVISILVLLYWLISMSFGQEHKKLQLKAFSRRVG